MKQSSITYIEPLPYLIIKSITQGIFPKEFKLAKVIPIYKTDNVQQIHNYRPISILPFFSKVMEKLVADYMMDFIDTNNILNNNQFGFRKGHSTSHAVITLVERVSTALDTGKIVVGVFVDLKKAFDTVNHKILLSKLYAIGIRGNLYSWFQSYLGKRMQFVYFNGVQSDTKEITHGVPQGSILGPLLFLIYVNDFSRASDIFFSIMYADDTNIFIEGIKYEGMIEIMNDELEKVDQWLKANKLTLNLRKTHYMVFHRSKIKFNNTTSTIKICNEEIECVNTTKFLGVIIDNKLKWTDHIVHIKNKISKSIGILYKTRKYLDKHTLRNLYYTFVYPYLIYCVEVWGNASGIHLDPIIKLQKQCVRTISFAAYREHTEPIFKELCILNFNKLVTHRIGLLMFKHSLELLPISISKLFTKNNEYHDHFTRQSNSLHSSIGRGESVYRSFSFHGINIWNQMSKFIPLNISYVKFKKLSKIYLQEHDMIYRLRQ